MPYAAPAPPGLRPAFRVGVTGTRALTHAAEAALAVQVGKVLDLVAAALPADAKLRVISPLAEGADRVVASVGLRLGWQVFAPLPFPAPEYEADFPDSVAAFRDLLGAAETLVLDGDRSEAGASYAAAGQFVVRNCDLLIAVWDGAPRRGQGGTAEIVRFAARGSVPVWWLAPDGGQPPRLLRRGIDLPPAETTLTGDAAWTALGKLIQAACTPPVLPRPDRPGAIGRLIAGLCTLTKRPEDPLQAYLGETSRRHSRVWRVYTGFMNFLAPWHEAAPSLNLSRDGPVETYWAGLHRLADNVSAAYGDRYRSCYLLVFLLASLAVLAASIGLAFPETLETPMTLFETAALLGIGGIVAGNHGRRFHERWIAGRLLAELCRKQLVLAGLGWSLPHWEVERVADDAAHHQQDLPRDAWVAWYFAAARRAAPLPTGILTPAVISEAAARGVELARAQALYHHTRQHRSEAAGGRLTAISEWTFLVTLLLVVPKLALLVVHAEGPARWLTLACTVLPAIAAASVGIRAYAEFELLAYQSARMQRELGELADELAAKLPDAPLTSQIVGARLYDLAMSMLRDIRGWAQLFRVKNVESG